MKKILLTVSGCVILIIAAAILFVIFDSAPTSITKDKLDTGSIVSSDEQIKDLINNATTQIQLIDVAEIEELVPTNETSYYFWGTSTLVVRNKIEFTRNLLFELAQHDLYTSYKKYLAAANPGYEVLPKNEFSQRYRELQIERFKYQIQDIKNVMASNESVFRDAQKQLSSQDPELSDLRNRVELYRSQSLNEIEKRNIIISKYSDTQSDLYRMSNIISGGFIQPASIIIQEPNEGKNAASNDINEIRRAVTHELLHYYADYYSKKNHPGNNDSLSDFLYEGLTEYLTLKSLGYNNETMLIHSGYPMHIQIMIKLASKIPLAELEYLHFSQDGHKLLTDLKKYFPNIKVQAFTDSTNEVHRYWLDEGFGQENEKYKNHPLITDVFDSLGS